MPERTSAHLILDLLVAAGVDRIFGIPGGPLLSLLTALDARPEITFVLAKHEEGAVFMAEGHAQATGRLGVACVTSGPGTTHALTAAASATADWAPVLVLAGQVSTEVYGRGGLQDSSGGNWSIDTVDVFRSAVKLVAQVSDPAQVPLLVERAIRTAMSPLPGAALLVLPSNILNSPAAPAPEADLPGHELQADYPGAPAARALTEVANALLAARTPVILAGQGAKVSGSGPLLVALAERLAAPVATTMKGKSVFPEDHALSLGVFGNYGGSPATHQFVLSDGVDLLLVVGSSLGEVSTFGWDPALAHGRTVCQIDADGLQIGKNYRVDHAIVADARTALAGLLDLLPSGEPAPQRSPVIATGAIVAPQQHPLRASAVAVLLSRRLPTNVLLFLDNGNTLCWIGEHYKAPGEADLFCSLNFGCMGYAIPASIGAKLALPARPVVAVVGDAAFAMGGMEIHTAVELDLPIVWLVLNNRGNAMVANLQELMFGTAAGSMYTRPLDAAMVARGLGAQARSASTLPELDEALSVAFADGGPWMIDITVDAHEIPWSLTRRAAILGGAE
ncbi:thiamine pyrophosphate-binding protein [Streptomyces microflavus]|uniref:thiamine pyrophosphate-binding protein n=1 Tax=Streptomyces microflavus TaxID=1919 RepID=UPI0037CE6FC7